MNETVLNQGPICGEKNGEHRCSLTSGHEGLHVCCVNVAWQTPNPITEMMKESPAPMNEIDREAGNMSEQFDKVFSRLNFWAQDVAHWLMADDIRAELSDALTSTDAQLAALRDERDRLARALERDAIAKALQSAWTDFCADTGCIPDCFTIHGPRTTQVEANFDRGNFAGFVRDWLLRQLIESEEGQ
jgi:hypothetical protein